LVRLSTGAALVGVVAGLWNIWEYFQVCRGVTSLCPSWQPAPTGTEGTVVLGLAVVLVLVSLATFIGPAVLFYLSAVAGAAIDALVVINYSSIAEGSFLVTVILVTISVVLGVVSAMRKTSVSEQSHPMNLPVFG
jgi:hypothetical protein